jgi:hypothetical protein
VEITLPNSQGNQSFRSVAGKRSSGRAVYLGDPRLALQGRSPVGAEKSALATPCPVAASSVFSGKVQRFGMHNIIANRYFASLKKRPQSQDFMHFVRENSHDCFVAFQYARPDPEWHLVSYVVH